MNNDLLAELARRELARRYYSEYLAYSYGASWIRTRLSSYLAQRIQNFIETDTGHAYDILIIECPPQHNQLLGGVLQATLSVLYPSLIRE